MDNSEIADQFSLLSRLMTLHNENTFKIRSYSNAAFQIDRLQKNLADMSAEEIGSISGIGAAIQKKIETLLETGHFPLLEKYLEDTPEGILAMLHIKGIGPKKLAVIWKELGIENAGELLYACNEDRLTRYKGFGAKTQESIRKAIDYHLRSLGHYLYAEALEYTGMLQKEWAKLFGKEAVFLPTGQLRRQCNTLTTLEFVTTASPDKISAALSESFQSGPATENSLTFEKESHPEIKFYFAEKTKVGNVLFQTTGSPNFVASFFQKYPQTEKQSFETEEQLFEATSVPAIPPALREKDISELPPFSVLIQPEDIKGIIHSHSTWSDGRNSIEQMALAARAMGMEYLVISDHSRSAAYASGLQPERVSAQHEEIADLNKKLAPFKIFKSIESDILSDGSLDYDDDILAGFDLIIASVHSNLKMDRQKATERLLKAISNPYTTILGHPTGRLLLSREGYPIDHEAIIDACVKHEVAIEINAHPRRLDLDWRFIPYALKKGAILSIDPDAHSLKGLEDIQFGVWSAQKGGLSSENNLSSFSLSAFEKYLADRKKKRTN